MTSLQAYATDHADHTVEVTGFLLGIPFVALCIATLVMWVAAIVSVARSTYSFGMKAVFICAILALPIAGSLAWFFVVKKNQPLLAHSTGTGSWR